MCDNDSNLQRSDAPDGKAPPRHPGGPAFKSHLGPHKLFDIFIHWQVVVLQKTISNSIRLKKCYEIGTYSFHKT